MAMISIRKMTEADLRAVHRISLRSFSAPWSLEAIQAEYANDLAWYLVARSADETIGFIGAWLVFDEVQITNLAVDPDHRGQGVARSLLRQLIAAMRERSMAVIFLEVRVSNAAAIALYESEGFQFAGYRKEFYPDREDAHVMSLDLK